MRGALAVDRSIVQVPWVATVIVVAIAIPLGILLTRDRAKNFRPVAVNFANIGQAAPAVGLIVLLTMWLGTGFRTAVIGLVVYAILPILQNTIVGIQQVDQRTIEAARGIGFSGLRTLVQVELPLAVDNVPVAVAVLEPEWEAVVEDEVELEEPPAGSVVLVVH